MISIDFGANLGFGARIRARISKKSIKDDKDTKTLMENTVAGTRTNTKSIQNLSVPQNVDFGFSDFQISDFRIFPKILTTFFSKTIKSMLTKNHQNRRYPIKIWTNPADL